MLRKSLFALMIAAAFGAAQADTLLLDGIRSAEPSRDARPASGLTKTEVEARFGEPTRMVAAVGDPPISRWEYPGFVVYFEFERVIHTVARR